jgi:rRNA maturation endonuclease Nob1
MLEKLKQKLEQVRDSSQAAGAKLLKNKVSEEIQQYRYSICQSCDKLYKPTDNCKVCGCFMKVKTWMPYQSCPIGKWTSLDSTEQK